MPNMKEICQNTRLGFRFSAFVTTHPPELRTCETQIMNMRNLFFNITQAKGIRGVGRIRNIDGGKNIQGLRTHKYISTFLMRGPSRRTRITLTKIMLPQCSIFTGTPNHIRVSNFHLEQET